MRTNGSFEYGEDAEEEVLRFVSDRVPATTQDITGKLRRRTFRKLHHATTKRLLENLHKKGYVRSFKIGRAQVWQK